MKARISGILFVCLLTLVALAVTASALPITYEEVKMDDVLLRQDQITRLDLEKNQKYDVDVLIEAQEDIDDMEIKVFVSGFEYSATDRAEDHKGPVSMEAGEARKFTFEIEFSDEFEQDGYQLRIISMDRDDDTSIGNYPIKIDVPRHSLKIEDVIFYPETKVEGGDALITTIRVENNGEKTQEDVKVKLSIPDFETSATTYINEIEAGDEKETGEIYLKMPKCGADGLHAAEIVVEYGEGHYNVIGRTYINFEQQESCTQPAKETVEVTVEQGQENNAVAVEDQTPEASNTSKIRKALEILLLVLVVLLVIIGLVIGFTRLGRTKEEDEY